MHGETVRIREVPSGRSGKWRVKCRQISASDLDDRKFAAAGVVPIKIYLAVGWVERHLIYVIESSINRRGDGGNVRSRVVHLGDGHTAAVPLIEELPAEIGRSRRIRYWLWDGRFSSPCATVSRTWPCAKQDGQSNERE